MSDADTPSGRLWGLCGQCGAPVPTDERLGWSQTIDGVLYCMRCVNKTRDERP